MAIIQFYKVNDPFGEFSNFKPSPILIEGEIWSTVEHYFQASKFDDFHVRDRIKLLESPMDAAKEGRNRNNKLKEQWEDIKNNVMYKGLKAKFLQHPGFKKVLLETGNKIIVEHTVNDNYWADGGDGSGKNMLGLLLMRVREELTKISNSPDLIFPPWIAFPSTDSHDLFWGMGLGEDYLFKWFNFINKYGIEKYRLDFPEPLEWKNTYVVN